MSEPTSLHKERYGVWAGRPAGVRCDPERCAEEVYDGHLHHQCTRRRGHGPEGAYCRQHDPAAKREREKAGDRKYQERIRRDTRLYGAPFVEVLVSIARGHNDPRAVAREVLTKYGVKVD